MARTAGILLVLLASASIALGSPLCCVLGTGCCGSAGKTAESDEGCCPHCPAEKPERPEPKPCDKEDCTCKRDVASHAPSPSEHVPVVAVLVAPAALPAPAGAPATADSTRALPTAPSLRTHPLLL
jgi:hypothetical protein